MELKTAMHVLSNEKACVQRNISGCDHDCGKCGLVLPDYEILVGYDEAMRIMELQVPKKTIGKMILHCPNCNKVLSQLAQTKFCDNCGQALLWE